MLPLSIFFNNSVYFAVLLLLNISNNNNIGINLSSTCKKFFIILRSVRLLQEQFRLQPRYFRRFRHLQP